MDNKNIFRKTFSLLAILLAVLTTFKTPSLEAANLHAVIVADTMDESIGLSTAQDLKNMRETIKKISLYTKLTLSETIIKGVDTVPNNVIKKINSLKIKKNDLVIFYFSGHGYRTDKKISPWPNLYFSNTKNGIDYDNIRKKLENFKPRLLIVLSDVCNSYIPDEYAPDLIRGMFSINISEDTLKKNYKALFLDTKGVVLITSSKSGEYSWCNTLGGVFTQAFIRFFNNAIQSSSEANWYTILDNTSDQLHKDKNQHPKFQISLE